MTTRTAVSSVTATLGINVVDTVNLADFGGRPIRIVNTGSTDIYAKLGNAEHPPADPVVGADDTYLVQAGKEFVFNLGVITQVKLIAALAVSYHVEAL